MAVTEDRDFLPAMGRPGLLALYDPFTRLLGARDAHWPLVAQAGIEPGQTVLEIGTGTGSVLLLVARAAPDATVIGLDPDPEALAVAGRTLRRAGVPIRLDRGYADRLPYPDGSVDRVLSSFMLHHLQPDAQQAALREVRRVLAPGGRLHLVDFDGAPSGPVGSRPSISASPRRSGRRCSTRPAPPTAAGTSPRGMPSASSSTPPAPRTSPG